MTAALETRGLAKRFGGLVATDDVSFRLETGARHALIGPNGAGKTTLVNLLTGVLPPERGPACCWRARTSRACAPEARVRRGLVRTFQINQLFADLTPLETLALGCRRAARRRARDWWRPRRRRRRSSREVDEAGRRASASPTCSTCRTDTLPYGKQRLLEIALAFACAPRVLLLDEPAAGVPEAERQDILDALAALPADVTVLLIEHDMDLVFRFAERISVLVDGALLTEGDAGRIAADPRVRAVYLGEAGHG